MYVLCGMHSVHTCILTDILLKEKNKNWQRQSKGEMVYFGLQFQTDTAH